MPQRIYLDSNVFISFINKEVGRDLRGLFIESKFFLEKVRVQKHILVLSDLFFKEVKKVCYLDKNEIIDYFYNLKIKTELINANSFLDVNKFLHKGMHLSDAIHAAIACSSNCTVIVTFNKKDFDNIKKEIAVLEPLDFI